MIKGVDRCIDLVSYVVRVWAEHVGCISAVHLFPL
jgi:hypothetical protein